MSRDSTRSPTELKIISDIILMIEDSWSDEEILECFPGVERLSYGLSSASDKGHIRWTFSQEK